MLILGVSASGCLELDKNLHEFYAGDWRIERVTHEFSTGDTSYQNLGIISLLDDPDLETTSAFNPFLIEDETIAETLLGTRYMRSVGGRTVKLFWYLDDEEKRFFLYGFGGIGSYIQIYTIQEDDLNTQRNDVMTLFIRINESSRGIVGSETIRLRKVK